MEFTIQPVCNHLLNWCPAKFLLMFLLICWIWHQKLGNNLHFNAFQMNFFWCQNLKKKSIYFSLNHQPTHNCIGFSLGSFVQMAYILFRVVWGREWTKDLSTYLISYYLLKTDNIAKFYIVVIVIHYIFLNYASSHFWAALLLNV